MNDSKEIRDAKNVLFIMKDELHFANLENARLKAEVERLKAEGDRLKEAGDEMAFHIGNDEWSQRKCADRWFDLREGKQS